MIGEMNKEYIIIGSGPAGIAAAKALLARHVSVTMLDAGVELEPFRKNLLDKLELQWDEKLYEPLKHNINTINNIKLSFGSDFPYQKISQHFNIVTDKNTHCLPSFARGGLSNLWGAYTAPYNADDLKNWPIKMSTLEPYYKQVMTILPINENYQRSQQANLLLKNINQHITSLASAGFLIKPVHLSVHFEGKETKNACFYCGNCQHGCPNSLIYSANDTLYQLLEHPKFTYIKDVVVKKIVEKENIVLISAHVLSSPNKMVTFEGERVFLAAGAIFSTAILLNSLGLFNHPILLKQSQHFMVPCLMKESVSNVENEKLHTLTQLALRLKNTNIALHPIHLQVYTYMDHYITHFRSIFKKIYPLAKPLLKPIINRMLVIQGYFHSEDSPACELQLSQDATTLSLKKTDNTSNSRKKVASLNRYFTKHHRQLGFTPVSFMTKFSKILHSNHYGSSFPMQAGERTPMTTDLLGRPYGMQKTHVVDATIFPTIPAQAITFTVMANAFRIASECPL